MEKEINDTTSEEQPQTEKVDEDDSYIRKCKQKNQTALLGEHFGYDPRCANEQFKVYRVLILYDLL